jgi:hypothetical protein
MDSPQRRSTGSRISEAGEEILLLKSTPYYKIFMRSLVMSDKRKSQFAEEMFVGGSDNKNEM